MMKVKDYISFFHSIELGYKVPLFMFPLNEIYSSIKP